MAQTVEIMFSNLAYRATVYRTGLRGVGAGWAGWKIAYTQFRVDQMKSMKRSYSTIYSLLIVCPPIYMIASYSPVLNMQVNYI